MKRVAGLAAGLLAMVGCVDAAPAAAKRADLALVKVSAGPMSVTPGGSVRVADTVRNRGAAKARATRLGYFLSKDARRGGADLRLSGQRKVKAVRVGKRARGARRLVVPASTPAGAYRLIACADATRKVKERNERNNCRAAVGVFRVTGGGFAGPEGVLPTPVAASSPSLPGGAPGPATSFPLTPSPLKVTQSLAADRSATQTMYGGFENSMSVTAADGTTYTLTLPQNALLSAQDVTMTPVAAVAGNPLNQGLVGAVQLEPHGLQLQKPAVLTIEAPQEGALEEQTGFLYHQGGHDFHLFPLAPERRLTLRPMHFATVGVGLATDRATALARVPARTTAQLEHVVSESARERRLQAIGPAARAALGPAAVFPAYFDGVVRPKLTAAETNDALAREAIAEALNWAKNAELAGLENDPEYDKRRTEMYDRITKVLRNAVEHAYTGCVDQHELEWAVRLASLARIAAVNGFDLGDVQDKLERCLRFEVDFESRMTATDGWTAPDGRTYDLDAVWHVRSLDLIIDITTLGAKPISWAEFNYEGLNTYPCGDDPPLHSYSRGVATKPGNLQALLSLDLNPRDAPPAGEPAPPPPDDYLQLLFTQPKETYRHWNEGCSNPYEPSDDEQSRWSDMFNHFHNGEFPFKVRIDRQAQVGDLLESKTWTDEEDTGTGRKTEFSTLDLWHKPQP